MMMFLGVRIFAILSNDCIHVNGYFWIDFDGPKSEGLKSTFILCILFTEKITPKDQIWLFYPNYLPIGFKND